MDASAITSAAQAVHQELVRKLAERGHTDPHLHAQPDAGSWLSPSAPGSFSGVAPLRPPAAPA
jgi:hypothetical protein